jgi:hypothetical protein
MHKNIISIVTQGLCCCSVPSHFLSNGTTGLCDIIFLFITLIQEPD